MRDDGRIQLRIRLYPDEWDAMIALVNATGAGTPTQLIRNYIHSKSPRLGEAHDVNEDEDPSK